jgi:hypothetical protein
VVTLTATPSTYWTFEYWTGGASGNQNPLNVTMNGPLSVQAVFVQTSFPLTLSTPGGGSVTANGQTISSSTYYPTGTVMTLAATPSDGWSFIDWQGAVTSTANPVNLTIHQTQSVQAIFGTSVVATNAVGGGIMVVNLPGLVPYGSPATVSAVPNPGNYFVTWSGALSGTNSPGSFSVTSVNPVVNALFTALPGGKYSLSAVLAGNGTLTVSPQQSYYNPGTPVTLTASTNSSGTAFFGWTGSASGTNNPLVVIVNSNMVVQANFTSLPTVSLTPNNLIVFAGSNATLNASVAGAPPLVYQWQYGGVAIAGATNTSYQIVNATTNNNGLYSLVAANSFGVVTSAVATVTVVFPPGIILPPMNQTVAAGSTATLGVTASGTPPLTYQWFDSKGAIPGATNATLVFSPAETNNWDNYLVQVASPYGSLASSPALLIVYQPVSILSQPASQLVSLGATVTFGVTASGFPAPQYQWTFSGTNIPGATSSTVTVAGVDLPNLGNYIALVSNGYSSTQSETATLTLLPSISSPFSGVIGIWGEQAMLSVGAEGSGTLDYQWYMNGVAIIGAIGATYTIPTLQLTNAGLYSVVISSQYGSVTNAAEQLVVNPANISLGTYAGVSIQGVVGYSYLIQYSTNLANTNGWIDATNLILQQPLEIWVDTSVDTHRSLGRYYRIEAAQ